MRGSEKRLNLIILEVAGLVLGFVGSILLLLKEPMRFLMKDGDFLVDIDQKGYDKRLFIRKIGILLIALGFFIQAVAVAGSLIL